MKHNIHDPFTPTAGGRLAIVFATILSGICLDATAITWDGGSGGTNNWIGGSGSNSGQRNWDTNNAPVANDPLVFAGTTRLTPNNNTTANTNYNGITFNSGAGAFTLGGNSITLGGNVVNNSTNLQTINMNLILSGSRTFNASTGNLAVGGLISESGAGVGELVKTGSFTLTLTNQNTYTGLTSINGGSLTYGVTNALSTGAVTINGGILNIATFNDTVGAVTLTSGSITGNGTLTGTSYALQGGTVTGNLGTGTATVTSGTTTLNGTSASAAVNINSGALALGASDRLDNASTVTVAGGALNTGSGLNDTVGTFNMSSGSLNGTGTITAGTYGLSGGTVTANLGAGTMNVSGAVALNGTSASAAVNVNSGALTLGASNRLNSSAAVTLGAGASLNLASNLQTVASLNGAGGVNLGSAGTGELTVGSGTVSGVISGDGTTGGGLVKTGTGTLALTGANTFEGNVRVQDGTLSFNTVGTTGTAQSLGMGTQGTIYLGVDGVSGGILLYTGAAGTMNRNVTVLGANSVIQNAGTGLLDIHGTINRASGNLTLAGGTAGITVSSAITGVLGGIFATGTVNLQGSYLDTTTVLTVDGTITLGDTNGGISQTVAGLSGSGAVRGKDAGESRLEASFDTGTQTFSGVIGGNTTGQNNIGFSKTGNGTQVLSGNTANTFTGLTNIDGGILSLAKNDGVNAIGGHAHVDSGTLQIAASEQIADNADVTIMGGAFAFAGSGKTETIGTFRNNGGNFTTGANTLIGTGNSIYFNGGTTTISNGGSTQDAHYLITAGTNTVEAGGTLEVLSGGLGLQFGGTASPTLNLASSNDTAGRVLLNSNLEVLSTSTSGTAQILSTGIGSNKGSIDLGGAPRTFTVNNGSAGTDLLISANIINGSLVKSGLGTLELAAANSYTGTTTVTAGTLSVTGSTGAGAVAIDSGATLTGNGKVGGVTNVTGVLAPGTGLATLTFGQSLTLAGAATTEFELDALNQAAGGGFNDLIAVGIDSAGDLALDGIINLTAWDAAIFTGFTADDHVKWTLFTYTGNLTIGNNLSFGSTPTLGFDSLGRAQSWVLDTTSTSGKVYATVIPEPSTMLLGAIGAAGLILRRRRR